MSRGITERLQRWMPNRWRRGGSKRGARERKVIDEVAGEYSTEELQEFLEADRLPTRADLDFKEELRERLWEMVQERARERGEEGRGR